MIIIAECDVYNCNFNNFGWCNTLPKLEDRYCVTCSINPDLCEACGCELITVKEPYECWGHEVLHDERICPECKE